MALADVIEQIKSWPLKRKIALIFVVAISIALMFAILLWSQRVDYHVLYGNLTPEDAGQVIGKLKEANVPYRVRNNVIYVPADRVYELRLELAAQGIPLGGGVGFELFDKTQIGVTEFVQRLNYIRALQGELTRTIRQLAEVEQARVHIAIPERTIFTAKEEEPTASVVLRLKPGRVLSQGQIGGIVHLVSSSVEGLQPRNVTIIDNMGNLLSKAVENNIADMAINAGQREYRESLNKYYESSLQSMLEGIVGRGNAIVRVATSLDFTQIEKTEERFDPDTIAIRTEQRTQENAVGALPGGIPGALTNQPGQPPMQAAGIQPSSQKQSENIHYEISRSVSRIIQPRGEVKNISVAVLVDGFYKKEGDKMVYVPRSEEDIKRYREIVMAAIGYNEDRGDRVIVESIPFETAVEELPPEKIDYLNIAISLLKYIIPLVAIALIILFVIKPIIEILKSPPKAMHAKEAVVAPSVAVVAPGAPPPPEDLTKEEVLEMAKKDPRKAAMILREWMSE
jgi:flagellar M-ring protein FliF